MQYPVMNAAQAMLAKGSEAAGLNSNPKELITAATPITETIG